VKFDPEVAAAAAAALRAQQALRPVHIHRCLDGEHEWTCPSPYCENVSTVPRNCVAHGGALPKDVSMEMLSNA